MREASLQWALRLGAVAGALALAAQFLGGRLVPRGYTSIDTVAIGVLVYGILFLFSVGVALGLSYYAGLRAEQTRLRDSKTGPIDVTLTWGGERRDSALAGAIVMALYWALGTLAAFLFAPRQAGPAGLTNFVTSHLISAFFFLLFGFGMGALGGRAPAARALLDDIATAPDPSSTVAADPPSAPGETLRP